jgi:hypothetical protein
MEVWPAVKILSNFFHVAHVKMEWDSHEFFQLRDTESFAGDQPEVGAFQVESYFRCVRAGEVGK